jgi:hypothetical protein
MTMWLTAEYPDEGLLAAGVTALLDGGFESSAIEVYSRRPVELPHGFVHRPSRASLVAVLGALVNGCLATAFMFYTQHDYPLVTGGMPLYSWWATGVVTYELTMAGAVAGVVFAFLWEAGLLRRHKPPAPALENGLGFVRVRCAADAAVAASECLKRSGALAIERLEGRA